MDTTVNNNFTDQQMPDPLIGSLLPRRYRITGRLGRGAMSVVYSGVYEPLGQPVAVKLLKSHLVSDQSTFKRFQQEAKTAGALEHPNIVGILDFGVTDQGVPYLIMELLHGVSLLKRLKEAPALDLVGLLELFEQIADGLLYTHERGIIHRDVKPSNLLVVRDEHGRDVVKIVDFGIAKMQTLEGNRHAELTATGEVFGTPLYVSPEQAMGRTLDPRADIYSLGCVMYEALAGKPPFNGPSAFDVIRMQINNDAIPLDAARPDLRFPPSLITVVERSMVKEREQRYQSMVEVIRDLRAAVAEVKTGVYGRSTRQNSAGMPIVSSNRMQSLRPASASKPLPAVQARKKAKLPIMLFILMVISGMITGVLILFCLDFKQKLELSTAPAADEMVVDAAKKLGSATTSEKETNDALQLASVALTKHDYKTAEGALNRAIPILVDGGDSQKENLANAYNLLGIAYYYMGDTVRAEPPLLKALVLDSLLYGEQSTQCAGVLTNLGRIYDMQKKFDRAEEYYRKSLAMSEKVKDKRLVNRIQNLAAFLRRRHKAHEASVLEHRVSELNGN